MAKTKKALAFDMGGTKLASAIIETDGQEYEILDYKKNETPKRRSEIVKLILQLAEVYSHEHDFKNIGFAVAGQISVSGDKVICAPNISELNNFRLGSVISQKTGVNVMLKNDVRAFALGEDRFGRYKGHDSAIFIAVGTGVGGAMKTGGKFYSGSDNIAGEFGHMVVECGGARCSCGRKGCWERYVSGSGVERMYEEAYHEKKRAREIFHDGSYGSKKDEKIMLLASSYFALGVSNLINILDPEIVIVGGSMVKEKKLLELSLPSIRREVLPSARRTKIVDSSLGDKAFLLGAALE